MRSASGGLADEFAAPLQTTPCQRAPRKSPVIEMARCILGQRNVQARHCEQSLGGKSCVLEVAYVAVEPGAPAPLRTTIMCLEHAASRHRPFEENGGISAKPAPTQALRSPKRVVWLNCLQVLRPEILTEIVIRRLDG